MTGGSAAIVNTFGNVVKGLGGVPVHWAKSVKSQQGERRGTKEKRLSQSHEGGKSRERRADQKHANKGKDENRPQKADTSGEQGMQSTLPKSHNLSGRAHAEIEKVKSRAGGQIARPAPGFEHERPDDHLTTSTESDHRLAHEIAEDTGCGIAKAGGALAKGRETHNPSDFKDQS